MVEATSSLPPIRYWVDVILTTVAVSAVRLRTRSSCFRASLCPFGLCTRRERLRGQLNAVRAARKAGITPSRIARQFGICQSNVRKVLASPELKR